MRTENEMLPLDQFALVIVNLLPEAEGGFPGVHFLEVAGAPAEATSYVQAVASAPASCFTYERRPAMVWDGKGNFETTDH